MTNKIRKTGKKITGKKDWKLINSGSNAPINESICTTFDTYLIRVVLNCGRSSRGIHLWFWSNSSLDILWNLWVKARWWVFPRRDEADGVKLPGFSSECHLSQDGAYRFLWQPVGFFTGFICRKDTGSGIYHVTTMMTLLFISLHLGGDWRNDTVNINGCRSCTFW